jgi:hypothetical protein
MYEPHQDIPQPSHEEFFPRLISDFETHESMGTELSEQYAEMVSAGVPMSFVLNLLLPKPKLAAMFVEQFTYMMKQCSKNPKEGTPHDTQKNFKLHNFMEVSSAYIPRNFPYEAALRNRMPRTNFEGLLDSSSFFMKEAGVRLPNYKRFILDLFSHVTNIVEMKDHPLTVDDAYAWNFMNKEYIQFRHLHSFLKSQPHVSK